MKWRFIANHRRRNLASPTRRGLRFVITMDTLDFSKRYEAMTNEELLNLATDTGQLSPEAGGRSPTNSLGEESIAAKSMSMAKSAAARTREPREACLPSFNRKQRCSGENFGRWG